MRKSIIAGLALWAVFAAFAGKVHADVNYPWCLMGDTRGYECVFTSREQCMQDGRNRGFGGQCIQNPAYKPGQPSIVSGPVAKRAVPQGARPSQALSTANRVYWLAGACGFRWKECMKTGFWEGALLHRQAERR
jgi:hypothetical protein